jgi:hypothetical protein
LVTENVKEWIEYVTHSLPLKEREKEIVQTKAIELASIYLNSLSDQDERRPLDIALSTIYLSCQEVGMPLSQYRIARSSERGLIGWPCIVLDICNKINTNLTK